MLINFYKYQGAGNDFIIIDNRNKKVKLSGSKIKLLCDRNFGIGADGLMLLENHLQYDFLMKYYNSDGNEGSMCGNGGRCIVAFAQTLNIIKEETAFIAVDGLHHAKVLANNNISLEMMDVNKIERMKEDYFLNTGSPHYVKFVNNLDQIAVVAEGRKIRYNNRFKAKGTNVNFVEIINDNTLKIRTYERGVENETLACGTGITAAAIVYNSISSSKKNKINVQAKGGKLKVSFSVNNNNYNNIWLTGPAKLSFQGSINI